MSLWQLNDESPGMPRSQLRLPLATVFVACVAVVHGPVGSWALSVGCAPSRWRLRWRATTAARSERLSRPPPVLRAPPLQERVRWRSASGLILGVLCADQDGFPWRRLLGAQLLLCAQNCVA